MDHIDFIDLAVVAQESMIEFERLLKCYFCSFKALLIPFYKVNTIILLQLIYGFVSISNFKIF